MEEDRKKYDFFISYTIADSPMARRIRDDLILYNPQIEVYLFEKIDNRAKDFWTDIVEALAQTKYFLFIDSPNARRAKWVVKECLLAWEKFQNGSLSGFLSCLLRPVGEWRNTDFYALDAHKIAGLKVQVPPAMKEHFKTLIHLKNDLFFDRSALLTAVGGNEENRKDKLFDAFYNERLFNGINHLVAFDFSAYGIFDHNGIYENTMQELVDFTGHKFKEKSNALRTKDFESELTSLGADIVNKEILVNDLMLF